MKIHSVKDDLFLILEILSDGKFHSGEVLSQSLGGISRTAINKKINRIREEYGIDFHSVQGKGYRLPKPISFLSEEKIRIHLNENSKNFADFMEIHGTICSTNNRAKEIGKVGDIGKSAIVCSEHQSEGRGRGDRKWVSPIGQNIYYSMVHKFEELPKNISSFSLVVGVAVARTLHKMGVEGVKIKWPNDVLVNKKKISGILIESIPGDLNESPVLITGIGLNCEMNPDSAKNIDKEWTDVLSNTPDESICRNEILASLTNNLVSVCQEFEVNSFSSFYDEFSALDITKGKKVYLSKKLGGEFIESGVSKGISSSGNLILDNNGCESEHVGGEISLRFDA